MKIKKYDQFLFEYEGGPPVKDPIKVSNSMMMDYKIEYDDEEEDEYDGIEKDIPILKNNQNFV